MTARLVVILGALICVGAGAGATRAGTDWPVSRAIDSEIHYRHAEILTVGCRQVGSELAPVFDCYGISFVPRLLGVWHYRITPLTPTSYRVSRLTRTGF